MPSLFRHSICNEVFQDWSFADACKAIRAAGYDGVEIAPFTLAENPVDITIAQRREYRDIMLSEGLDFVGLHWLMVSPKGLHVTTPDEELRTRSWNHIRTLIDLCADLNGGAGGVMIFGSPHQRSTTGGLTPIEATRNYVDGMVSIAPHAEQRAVTILIEALPAAQSDVVTSLDEAACLVKEINSPAIQTMFDVHNAIDETQPHDVLVDRHFERICHVHVNELDGRHCGTGHYDFRPVFQTLARRGYTGWISLEAFDFSYGAEAIANDSLRYLENVMAGVGRQAVAHE
jgi:sugar phosphate isomerase/epimerase